MSTRPTMLAGRFVDMVVERLKWSLAHCLVLVGGGGGGAGWRVAPGRRESNLMKPPVNQ